VLVVDDHPALRCGVCTVLSDQADMVVCGEASSGKQAVELATELQPDVMLLDLQLGDFNGWSVVRELRSAQLPTKIILFSHHDERYVCGSAYRAHCDGFVSKAWDTNKLTEAIRTVHKGQKFFGLNAVRHSA